MDVIQTKVLRVFLLAIQTHLNNSFALSFLLLQTHATSYSFYGALLYTVKEKGGKSDRNHTPCPMVKEIHTETSRLKTLKIMATKINETVHP